MPALRHREVAVAGTAGVVQVVDEQGSIPRAQIAEREARNRRIGNRSADFRRRSMRASEQDPQDQAADQEDDDRNPGGAPVDAARPAVAILESSTAPARAGSAARRLPYHDSR
jgi:hypothetical protein